VSAGETRILACQGLEKSWGGIRALAGVDFPVLRGEILGLAGANRAGKSTRLYPIGGQLAPDAGRIEFEGRHLQHLPPPARRRLGIGRTFQNISVFAGKSVLYNVALAAQYGGSSRWFPPLRFARPALRAAHEVIELLDLSGLERASAGELGVYAQKRLMLAMAIVPAPKLLLLDEPAGGLSPREVDETVSLVRLLRDRGTTVVLVDHVMSFLVQVAERLVVLHEGRVLCEGLPDEVMRDRRVRETWLGQAAEVAA
jgi:ABC-type branched-subunit amino acid transport system ATPase component